MSKEVIMNSFFNWSFNYGCCTVFIITTAQSIYHERCLQLIYNDKFCIPSTKSLNQGWISSCSSQKYLGPYYQDRCLKLKNNVVTKIVNDVSYNDIVNHHGLKHLRYFRILLVNWVYYSTKSTLLLNKELRCYSTRNLTN